ncbi:MAG: sulfate reduction electron transfer complex DsrMKJOP subunit DsrJ [Bacteroidales bacterium]
MNDRPVIIAGLVLFLAAFTFPVWYNVGARTRAIEPALVRPKGERACVAPREYMRASHMTLLATWRDDAVRRRGRTWTAHDGRIYDKSLSRTCLRCHASTTDFCDRCHDYFGASPTCKTCHVMSAQRQQPAVP